MKADREPIENEEIPLAHKEILEERIDAYEKGKVDTITLEEVKRYLHKK